jgi:hypothetical protein
MGNLTIKECHTYTFYLPGRIDATILYDGNNACIAQSREGYIKGD